MTLFEALPPGTQEEASLEYLREFFRGSLYHFAKHVLGYKDINWRTHGDVIKALEDDSPRKLIVMPRGTFKSSIGCVAYPIWMLIRDPNLRVLIDSEVYTNSKNFLREIRGHLQSQRFIQLFGDLKNESNWNEGEATIVTRTRVLKEASITAGGIGAIKVGQHYDLIVGDDYNSNKNSGTPEARKKIIDHYRMNTAILEPTGIYVIIGTRYSTDDLIGHVMEHEVHQKGLVPT